MTSRVHRAAFGTPPASSAAWISAELAVFALTFWDGTLAATGLAAGADPAGRGKSVGSAAAAGLPAGALPLVAVVDDGLDAAAQPLTTMVPANTTARTEERKQFFVIKVAARFLTGAFPDADGDAFRPAHQGVGQGARFSALGGTIAVEPWNFLRRVAGEFPEKGGWTSRALGGSHSATGA
jgi:hypothetical protein